MAREMIGPMPKLEAESLIKGFKAADTWKLQNDLDWFEWNLDHRDEYTSWNDDQVRWIISQIKEELENRFEEEE